MRYPLVRDLAADGIPVAVTCRVLKYSKQAFYAWRRNPVTQRDWDDAHLINAAYEIHDAAPEFGYRLVADELTEHGISAGENRVARLCSLQQIWSVHSKKRGLNRKAGPPAHDDLIGRDFSAEAPNVKWLTDITEHWTGEGKLYLCAIKDCHSNKIVGYAIGDRMKADLAVRALRNAIALRNPARTVVHSDRAVIPVAGLRQNAREQRAGRADGTRRRVRRQRRHGVLLRTAAEERPGPANLAHRDELRLAIVTWIERTYHRRRRQRALGKLTPIEFELLQRQLATAA